MDLHHHISSDKLLLSIGGSLFVLTMLTTAVHYMHIPEPFSIIVAMFIAFGKASLVALFFMGLYWDKKFNLMLLIASLIFFSLLVGLTMLDVLFRVVPTISF